MLVKQPPEMESLLGTKGNTEGFGWVGELTHKKDPEKG